MKERTTIAFLGASIVQGKVSCSFVGLLKNKLGTKQYRYVNHAVAGIEAYNVLTRLPGTIALKPDMVVILVGSNDVTASLDPKLEEVSRRLKKIPHPATLKHYAEDMTEIVQRLKRETQAKIALVSLPVLGEDLTSRENARIREYNAALKQIADKEQVSYLPVCEKQHEYLMKRVDGKGRPLEDLTRMVLKSMFKHYVLLKSFDRISEENGFKLLTDGIHLNSIGAGMIADELALFVRDELTDSAADRCRGVADYCSDFRGRRREGERAGDGGGVGGGSGLR